MKKLRINFDKDLKMNLVCGDGGMRPVFENIYFENGIAYATDAHILVANALSECTSFSKEDILLLNGKYLHKNDYLYILAHDIVRIEEDGIVAVQGVRKTKYYFNVNCGTFPNVASLIKSANENPNVPVEKFAVSLLLLDKLVKGLHEGSKSAFFFKGGLRGIIVKNPSMEYNSVGLIMPLTISEYLK